MCSPRLVSTSWPWHCARDGVVSWQHNGHSYIGKQHVWQKYWHTLLRINMKENRIFSLLGILQYQYSVASRGLCRNTPITCTVLSPESRYQPGAVRIMSGTGKALALCSKILRTHLKNIAILYMNILIDFWSHIGELFGCLPTFEWLWHKYFQFQSGIQPSWFTNAASFVSPSSIVRLTPQLLHIITQLILSCV